MNSVLRVIAEHRSFRHFDSQEDFPIDDLAAIVEAAQRAPSWMNGQHYSMIHLKNKELIEELVQRQPNNPQIATCGAFLLFIVDAYRQKLASDAYDGSFAAVGTPDTLLTLCTDTALAAQNALLAAESMGYGTCFIGGIRQVAGWLVERLHLPMYTFPLFGLCIGKPTIEMQVKPRLPKEAVFFTDHYVSEGLSDALARYEKTMTEFGEKRESLPYREKFARYFSQTFVPENIDLLKKQGFLTKV